MSTLTKDEQETLRLLVQHVARAFYEPKYVVVLDQLVRHPVLKDDDLAGRMGLQLKELNKVMAVLDNDKLVRVHRQNELKEGAQRSVGKQYYYIDYQHFCNVVKWRMKKMQKIIDTGLRNELDNKGYICPQCQKTFSPLEVDKLMDFTSNTFVCDICHAEVVENKNSESVLGSQDRMQRFNRQMRFIVEGLRRTEDMILPAFDVALWVKTHIIDAEKAKAAAQGGGLKIAGTSGDAKPEDAIGVVLSVDKDDATQRLERDLEAAAKRQQNLLPAWHLKSTITGDLTALGIRENARTEEDAAAANRLPSSNDVILKGLGVVGAHRPVAEAPKKEEKKPAVVQMQEADYYDRYYASLAASAVPSGQDTPGSDFGDEEEDVKPSIQYLDSLNEYRKRSRSHEDVDGGSATPKLQRMNGHTEMSATKAAVQEAPVAVSGLRGEINGVSGAGDEDMEAVEDVGAADDPLVYVNGQPVPFSQVTEEHQELMTPEEYTKYFEIFSARS
ncbi:TFIIE alpha subunit-domain-containing protein [Sparassis latifolia]